MLGTVAMRTLNRTAFPAARGVSTASNFGEAWRYDKGAFKTWATKASTEDGVEKKQLYAHLALSFGDVDNDKDGWINPDEFDLLLEKVAALPRRFGLAPSWQVEYGGDVAKRTAARKAMFDAIDGADGFKPRGKIAMGQFLKWSTAHIFSKVGTIQGETGRVAFRHVEDFTKDEYVSYVDEAVNKPDSIASTTLYNYLLTLFVEADIECKGKISYEQFDGLVEIAAASPRHFGLAPAGRDAAARRAMFDAMDYNKSGHVTFRKFLRFVREHAREKVADYKASN
jgi:Ca2+-binding EF-hand superfamily protein